jgi:SAM-dependent methyltransferase
MMGPREDPTEQEHAQEGIATNSLRSGNPSIENIREVYESFPFPSGGTRHLVSHWTELIKRYFAANDTDLNDKLFLDAGCGTGDNVIAFAKAFPQIRFSACDLSRVSVDIAKKSIQNSGIENVVSFEHQDLMKFNSTMEYDFIASLGVLHHTPSPELCLQNLMEALKPGGTIFIDLYGYYGHLSADMGQRIVNLLEPDFCKLEDRLAAMEWVAPTLFGVRLPPERNDPEYICTVDGLLSPIAIGYEILEALDLLMKGGARRALWWDAPTLLPEALVYTNYRGQKSGIRVPARWYQCLERMSMEERYRFYELWFAPFDFFLVGQK